MKAEELRLKELVSFEDGLVSLHGRRLVLHDIHAMAQLRRDLVQSLGGDQARRILTRFGYYWGEADAAAMKRLFEWDTVAELLRAGPRLHALQGVTRADVRSLDVDADGGLKMEVVWHNSAEAEEHLLELGPSSEAVCWIQQGYASGYASFCLGRQVCFVERSCRARGDRYCEVIGLNREFGGDEAESLCRYLEIEDIHGKIVDLTNQLRKKTLELARQRKKVKELTTPQRSDLAETRSRSFQQVLDLAVRVARFDTSVLITGESGVGKELIASKIHDHSLRKHGPFVAINCGALPETLLESELFGHKAGSFTGAVRDRTGLLEEANGGTVLLDEIGEIPPPLQVKLLRVLQEKQVRPVGDNKPRDIDVRVVAATNRQLEKEVREGRFREDLFYRLQVVEIAVPPLRDRPEDIIPLARHLTERIAMRLGISELILDAGCIETLMAYQWPGNVREMENALERAAVVSEGGRILSEHLPPNVRHVRGASGSMDATAPLSLAQVERNHITHVLHECDGNRRKAARVLGVSTTTLWRKLRAWAEDT